MPEDWPAGAGGAGWLAQFGSAMRRARRTILAIQWTMVLAYLVLLLVPAFMPLPPQHAHFYDNLRLFAQFLFWGVWWPFVILSTMLLGRVWCGVFCPEGTLTEFASSRGCNRSIPRWMRWSGWPFTAFAGVTIYGQLIGIYQYPLAALLILGSSSAGAITVGCLYGRGTRLWCRYLCPANGVFGLLAKIAPIHFRVDQAAWKRNSAPQPKVNCAPLIDIRHMKSASACHACGRCSDYRGAVTLAARSPAAEILNTRNQDTGSQEALMLIFGVIGIATATFLWPSSDRLARLKTMAADWLVRHDATWLLQDNAPWWLLTNHPAAQHAFTWLDGAAILVFITGSAAALGLAVLAAIRLAAHVAGNPALSWQRLSLALVPIAGAGVFLGLSMLSVAQLKAEAVSLEWVPLVREIFLVAGSAFSGWLGWKLLAEQRSMRALLAFGVFVLPIALMDWIWVAT